MFGRTEGRVPAKGTLMLKLWFRNGELVLNDDRFVNVFVLMSRCYCVIFLKFGSTLVFI